MSKKLTAYRHVLPTRSAFSQGGVAIRVDVDFDTKEVEYTFARCSSKDVYDHDIGETLCDSRYPQQSIKGYYNTSLDFKENATLTLNNLFVSLNKSKVKLTKEQYDLDNVLKFLTYASWGL